MIVSDADDLLRAALRARANAYAPLTRFHVGAAIRTEAGAVYAGANVEEAALTSSLHAEQSAVAAMVGSEGATRVVACVVVVEAPLNGDDASFPCGHCRQLLAEFMGPDARVATYTPDGVLRAETTFGALLPHAFRFAAYLREG